MYSLAGRVGVRKLGRDRHEIPPITSIVDTKGCEQNTASGYVRRRGRDDPARVDSHLEEFAVVHRDTVAARGLSGLGLGR